MAMLARSESRDGYAVRVLAVHTTEGSGTAESLRDAAWWTGSSHALADASGKLLTPAEGCVPYNLASWTLRSGNRWSENIELVGFAKWKRGDWLARPKLLDACARWLAERSVARGIPLVKLSPKEYAAGRSGVIGHVDHTIGYSDGTHWDPGPDFPYDVVLPKAAEYAGGKAKTTTSEEDDMFDEVRDRGTLERAGWQLDQVKAQTDRLDEVQTAADQLVWGLLDPGQGLRVQVASLQGQIAALTEALTQLPGGSALDMAAVKAVADEAASKAATEALAGLADRLKPAA